MGSQKENIRWVVLGDDKGLTNHLSLSPCKYIKNLTTLYRQKALPDAIILSFSEEEKLNDCVVSLRSHADFYLLPIFCANSHQSYLRYLVDGDVKKQQQCRLVAQKINDRLILLPQSTEELSDEKRLLRYLYTHPHQQVGFFLDAHDPHLIRYPLIEFFFREEVPDQWQHVQLMQEQSVLKALDLEDELQSCPGCQSGLLNFKNICPECKSINIELQKFIHCFNCGNTAPEKTFITGDILQCKNCMTKLRHIGVDYDRPIEDNVCHNCQYAFMDPDVAVTCLTCFKILDPMALETRRIYTFQIGERGIRMAKNQFDSELYQLKDNFNYVSNEYFYQFLSWEKSICLRHHEMSFTVFAIKVTNQHILSDEVGANVVHQVIDELMKALRQLLRTTDLCSRYQDEYVVFLCPQTGVQDAEIIESKISEMVDKINEVNEFNLQLAMRFISSTDEGVLNSDDKLLIAELITGL